jgi:glycosyltransferase involved in cell wall biosynthesis
MNHSYVIVTPAYNEAAYLRPTIESVLRQTVLPARWVIVDDGSTDDTSSVVRSYIHEPGFLVYHRRQRDKNQSYFASNVYAIMEGVRQVASMDYGFLAVLDADIILPEDYYAQILARFDADPKLGVASGIYENLVNGQLQKVIHDRRSTPKAIQVFRRACFEQIGGYVPMKYGGEDTCACTMARMQGWKSWSFPELKVIHCRPTGLGNARSILRARFTLGLYEYGLGSHPLFVLGKCVKRALLERPYLVGAMARLLGFLYGSIKGEPRQISKDVVRFVRKEQLGRVFHFNRVPSDLQVRPA